MIGKVCRRMKAKTELLLYRMGWVLDRMMHPTFRNIDDSFECWAYRSGWLRQIQALEANSLVESKPDDAGGKRLYRLTELGRLAALGGRDPEHEWSRRWDGLWRMVLFDVPESERRVRGRVRLVLRQLRFGFLQKSVWISPHPLTGLADELRKLEVSSTALMLMEGKCCAGESPQEVAAFAWNFGEINRAWQRLATHLDSAPSSGNLIARQDLAHWSDTELAYWKDCAALDPLLPAELLPAGYLGRSVWKKRREILASLGASLDDSSRLFGRSSE